MAARDATSGQLVMAALWRAALDMAACSQEQAPREAKDALMGSLREAFSRSPQDASYVACLQSFALAHRGVDVPAGQAALAAKASGRLQAGALQASRMALFCWCIVIAVASARHALSEFVSAESKGPPVIDNQ